MKWLGTHNFKAGAYLAESTDNGQVTERPFNILDSSNQLLERVAFTPGQPFRNRDMEYAFFGQDHWIVSRRLALDLGVRTESQALSESFRVAPRAGIAWTPFGDKGTVVRAGFGFFYDRVPLSVYSFDQYPNETITMFGPGGQITARTVALSERPGHGEREISLRVSRSLKPGIFRRAAPPATCRWSSRSRII